MYSNVMPRMEAFKLEKYMRSLQYNSSFQWNPAGDWHLEGMNKPYPRNLLTGKVIRP